MRVASLFPIVACFAGLCVALPAHATIFTFATDPFAGSTALTTPGRQVVGNEISIPVFDFAADTLAFNTNFFDIPAGLSFFNGVVGDIPASGTNFVVLRTFDGDGDSGNGNQLNAGTAANLIAGQITAPGAGFFIYFNSGLDLPRLVYSTDLGSSDADLKVLARFTGLTGDAGRNAMSGFTAANIAAVPEPASWAMMIGGFALVGGALRRREPARLTA